MNAEERERQNGLKAINSLMAGVKVLYVYTTAYVCLHFVHVNASNVHCSASVHLSLR
jgi:hypothetical protein